MRPDKVNLLVSIYWRINNNPNHQILAAAKPCGVTLSAASQHDCPSMLRGKGWNPSSALTGDSFPGHSVMQKAFRMWSMPVNIPTVNPISHVNQGPMGPTPGPRLLFQATWDEMWVFCAGHDTFSADGPKRRSTTSFMQVCTSQSARKKNIFYTTQ
jgi:hypothetical protein